MFAISYLPQIQVNNGHKVMYKLRSMWNYADRHIFDVLEILGFLALFLVIGALIMALSGPLGIIRTAISNSDQEQDTWWN